MRQTESRIQGHNKKPLGSISLDLDNQWSYMKTHGDPGWEKFPSYFDELIPSVLELLDHLHLKITFFIVGQDAALDKNADTLRLLTEHGHEVGNHSFHHEPWLHLYPKDQMREEITRAEGQIERVTGQKPVGFRGPGFVWSRNLLEILAEREYIYDASVLPNYLAPLARLYYFWTANFTEDEKDQRKKIYGSISDAMGPVKPYCVQLDSGVSLLEIPVTTVPIIKTPFHLSYLLYLSRFSILLMSTYLRIALTMCRITRTAPSFLLHPLDFLSGDRVPELRFFPGMDISTDRKIELFVMVFETLSSHFDLANMTIHARSILEDRKAKIRYPRIGKA